MSETAEQKNMSETAEQKDMSETAEQKNISQTAEQKNMSETAEQKLHPGELAEEDLFNFSYLELCKLIQETSESRDHIAKENVLLERYMISLQQKDHRAGPEAPKLEKTKGKIPPTSETSGLTDFSTSISSFLEMKSQLGIEEKCEIAANEIRLIKEKIIVLHHNWYRAIIPYKVKFEEVLLSQHDVQQDKQAFDQDVASDGINISTGKVMLEKVLLYFKRSIRGKDIQLERCRLYRSTLLALEKRIEDQLRQKEELGDTLREVDYDQLKIENALYGEKVEDRNLALLKVKYLMSVNLQLLGQQKMKLKQLLDQEKEMRVQFTVQHENLKNLENEIVQATDEVTKMERSIHHLKFQLENYRVPDVMDYINTQAENYELAKVVNLWRRRVNIVERNYHSKASSWDRVKRKHKLQDFDVDKCECDKSTNVKSDEQLLSEDESEFLVE